MTSIESYAFYNCSSLTSIYCKSTTPPLLKDDYGNIFGDNISGYKIYVPSESVDAYKKTWWSYVADIVAYDFE